jgi:LysR family glycine cleavage system transcriptional activator
VSLPPLHFLHAVEAAGRLGSFRAAAVELRLTPSAVSQQIRAVEAALGARLFVRNGRAVMLTREGQLYCEEVRRALRDLADAGRRAHTRSSARVLRLCTVDVLAHEFLIPRLPAFQARFPKIELRIETSMRVVELHTSELDCALRVRGKAGPGLTSEPIGSVIATPICSPQLALQLRDEGDLAHQTLIEMHGAPQNVWPLFMKASGVAFDALRILSFESYLETLIAAERGLGVALGLFPTTTEWVNGGRLAVPFGMRIPVEGGVYFVFRANDPRRALLGEVAAWLREQYAELPLLPAGRVPQSRARAAKRTPKSARK